jgi:hypothetical protein
MFSCPSPTGGLQCSGAEERLETRAPVLLTTSVGYGFASVNVLERCVNRLKQWRGIATRYEKRAENYQKLSSVYRRCYWGRLAI